jgi:glycosyltransferase involved in cell wall biosynthesis
MIMPRVSVIIPTHNRAEFLEKAIHSVLNQSYTDFEILVCDDASSDDTRKVVEAISDERIRFIRYEQNRGVIRVRNEAISNSSGDYIAFLDDDDEWLPTKLEKQIAILGDSTNKLGGVYTGVYSIDTQLGRIVKTSIPKYSGDILNELLMDNFITTSSVIIKKYCFERVGLFDPEYKSASDYDMWIRIAAEFNFDYVAEPLVNYRNHPKKISTNYDGLIRGLERLISKHENLFTDNRQAYVNHLLKIGVFQCFNNNSQEGRKTFRTALRFRPLDIRLYYNMIISFLGRGTFIKLKETKQLIAPP